MENKVRKRNHSDNKMFVVVHFDLKRTSYSFMLFKCIYSIISDKKKLTAIISLLELHYNFAMGNPFHIFTVTYFRNKTQ